MRTRMSGGLDNRHRPGRDLDQHLPDAATGRMLMACGLGLLATSLCYAIAGPLVGLPGGATDMRQAAVASMGWRADWMRAAGLVGIPSDVVLVIAACLVLRQRGASLRPADVAGWVGLALSGGLFLLADTLFALVLPPVALSLPPEVAGDAPMAYAVLRRLFDALFVMGALVGGVSAGLLAWPGPGRQAVPLAVVLMRCCLALAAAGTLAWLAGVDLAPPTIGAAVVLGALALLVLGRQYLNRPVYEVH